MQVNFDITTDDVEGLDDFVSEALDNYDFNDAISHQIENHDFTDIVQNELREQLADAVEAEVDDMIDEKITTCLKDHDEARKVIRDIVKECLQEILNNIFNVLQATPV